MEEIVKTKEIYMAKAVNRDTLERLRKLYGAYMLTKAVNRDTPDRLRNISGHLD